VVEEYEERAAIMEFDGHSPDAEREAAQRVADKYDLCPYQANTRPPNPCLLYRPDEATP